MPPSLSKDMTPRRLIRRSSLWRSLKFLLVGGGHCVGLSKDKGREGNNPLNVEEEVYCKLRLRSIRLYAKHTDK